jgi:hypothetical protein
LTTSLHTSAASAPLRKRKKKSSRRSRRSRRRKRRRRRRRRRRKRKRRRRRWKRRRRRRWRRRRRRRRKRRCHRRRGREALSLLRPRHEFLQLHTGKHYMKLGEVGAAAAIFAAVLTPCIHHSVPSPPAPNILPLPRRCLLPSWVVNAWRGAPNLVHK